MPRSRLIPFVLAWVTLTAALPGCGDSGQVMDRADLVNELASQLDGSGELTYSAEYQLPGGGTAMIAQAQSPFRSAYVYPDGKLTVTDEAVTDCRRSGSTMTCTLTAAPTPNNEPAVAAFRDAGAHGLIAPTVVIGLLTTAALDTDATIEQSGTTIAGRPATCVAVRGVRDDRASAFDACITTDGVLGSFSGAVDGSQVDIALTRYRDVADPAAFTLPAGAKVIDKRTGT
ncbi:hypothetical protein RB614_29630 [Phytohabitans sp. ZYX-F-186]|uniref:Lipoprotein n=1 Tax=Phytohabitans maris TaxID=3071409 RepID=A0ABU0ZNU2_9ACTN|nr:hypothetical protein [Phytohabitans sp. ZYX-F-186]MDQ7908701.1 hypothetical protein [Phytohabitans sp. ZYX-F-186]